MRAIGASDGAIFRVIAAEGIVIGALAWVLGVLLSVPLSRILTAFVGAAFLKGPMTDVFAAGAAIALLPILIALTLLASVPPAMKASRMAVRDVLAYY